MAEIHWFPGHMNKALHEIEDRIKLVDVVVELLDARCPKSSLNNQLNSLIKNKKRLIVLTKTDLADPDITRLWKSQFEMDFDRVIALDLTKNNSKNELVRHVLDLGKEKRQKDINRGMKPQPLKTMIIGIPNVGKSSLINRLANRRAAGVQNKPGFTKGEQWIRVNNDFLLLDTPGVLPMSYEDKKTAVNLALIGSIKEEILPKSDLFDLLLNYLRENYPDCLVNRFNIPKINNSEEVKKLICENRHMLDSNGNFDFSRAEAVLLKEFKDGLLGKISLEKI